MQFIFITLNIFENRKTKNNIHSNFKSNYNKYYDNYSVKKRTFLILLFSPVNDCLSRVNLCGLMT